ncbi:MAG: T9SS type A sorting domain-containing protein [Bacteroidetes bacterium]|nr:T9SS type A sorting domain-containing protein [Bacteroidota bacterium]
MEIVNEDIWQEFITYDVFSRQNEDLQNSNSHIKSNKSIEIHFKDSLLDFNFQILPNPNNGLFSITIQNSEDKYTTFEFIDTFGRVIKKISTNEVSIQVDLTAFKKGVYYVRAKSINNNSIKKISIQ